MTPMSTESYLNYLKATPAKQEVARLMGCPKCRRIGNLCLTVARKRVTTKRRTCLSCRHEWSETFVKEDE